ncbi:hypothetical protein L228DRAFT_223655 [Xylona heveae TC161]|uniref:FAD-binding FR-type domain-containing protein n=1 Tax=Xylona heveae (strain CBS 132557 / TC161) TaxID=1328760 RepID=A0A165A148_XYLHT|nr:hypothetical protein L228DRAFT_223655 [Xylona heveae TC161]KZF19808.1 hypothetical protein L228DRAFT_223655 [Xylona heveae TC161]
MMDMSPNSNSNITNLPLTDPRCNSDACAAYKAAHLASQQQISWASQFLYGHYVTWYYIVALGLGMLVYGTKLLRNQYPRALSPSAPSLQKSKSTRVQHKIIAIIRSISYRRIRGRFGDSLGLPSVGIFLFVAFTCLYLLLLTFVQRPYYRLHRGFGSPPLAVRTGLMAIALTPIIVALAGKVNLVSMLTGISHEKLNVLHRYTSYMCLFLSIVHTVPFIVAPIRDGGAEALRKQFYKKGAYEFTGTPALGMLVGLCLLSIPWIRRYAYNLFYRLHILLYIVYLGLMFWHAGQELDSWAYLWATLAVYLASIVGRLLVKWQTFNILRSGTWYRGFPAQAVVLPGDMTKVNIFGPVDFVWTPGQHCWLRFPHLSMLQNHPFTIASVPCCRHGLHGTSKEEDEVSCYGDVQRMTFYIRSYNGLTRRLEDHTCAEIAKDDKSSAMFDADGIFSVHVDGPYGGIVEDLSSLYDCVVFVAGGGGVASCMPWMLHLARRMRHTSQTPTTPSSEREDRPSDDGKSHGYNGREEHTSRVKVIHLIWMVRHPDHLEWITSDLAQVVRLAGHERVKLEFYVTGNNRKAGMADIVPPPHRSLVAKEAKSSSLAIDETHEPDHDLEKGQQSQQLSSSANLQLPPARKDSENETVPARKASLKLDEVEAAAALHSNTRIVPETAASAMPQEDSIAVIRHTVNELRSIHPERPYLPDLLPGLLEGHRRIMIYGCGPESLKIDLSNATAKAQSRVLRGKADKISLHTETFGW